MAGICQSGAVVVFERIIFARYTGAEEEGGRVMNEAALLAGGGGALVVVVGCGRAFAPP